MENIQTPHRKYLNGHRIGTQDLFALRQPCRPTVLTKTSNASSMFVTDVKVFRLYFLHRPDRHNITFDLRRTCEGAHTAGTALTHMSDDCLWPTVNGGSAVRLLCNLWYHWSNTLLTKLKRACFTLAAGALINSYLSDRIQRVSIIVSSPILRAYRVEYLKGATWVRWRSPAVPINHLSLQSGSIQMTRRCICLQAELIVAANSYIFKLGGVKKLSSIATRLQRR